MSVEEGDALRDVVYRDANAVVAVGAQQYLSPAGSGAGAVLRSSDGGDTWLEQTSTTTREALYDVVFTDINTGTAIGGLGPGGAAGGVILRTTNGGNTWVEQHSGTDYALKGVAFVDAMTGFAVGGRVLGADPEHPTGVILRTTDGGDTWTSHIPTCVVLPEGDEFSCRLKDVSCPDHEHCIAVGDTAIGGFTWKTILRTEDGGDTWLISLAEPSSPVPAAVSCIDATNCIAVGGRVTGDDDIVRAGVWGTTNGGASWVRKDTEQADRLNGVVMFDSDNAIAVGRGLPDFTAVILRTMDGGDTWVKQITPAPPFETLGEFTDIGCADESTCIAVGLRSVLRTVDGGETWVWEEVGEATRSWWRGVSTTNAGPSTIVGDDGSILRTVGGPTFPVNVSPNRSTICVPDGGIEEISAGVSVNAVGGYAGTVSLSTSGEPSGVTSDLSPNSVEAPGGSAWTLTVDESAATGHHGILLTADDGTSQQLADFFLEVVESPQAPALVEPANGAVDVAVQPTFTWDEIEDVDTYRIQVATDSDFSDVVIDEEVAGASNFTPAAELDSDTQYFWRVHGIHGCAGAWSDVFSFTTEPQPVAEITPEGLDFELVPGETGDTNLSISNVGSGELVWSIETTQPPTVTGDDSVGRTSRGAQAATGDDRVDTGSETATLDLASVLEAPLPSLSPTNPAGGVVDCDNEPNIIIHDDGTVENGYTGDPGAGVTEMSFVDRFTPSDYPASFRAVCVAFISMGPLALDFEIVVFDDDGPSGGPGSELGALPVSADGLPGDVGEPVWFSYDISSLGLSVDSGSVYIGARWAPSNPNVFIASDESPGNPPGFAGGYWWNDVDDVWGPTVTPFPNYRSLFVRAVEGPPTGCDDPTTVSWLSVTPDSGTTPAGGSTPVEVGADTTGLDSGEYIANLCIATNDFNPAHSLIVVPVHLAILGSELVFDPSSLDFGEVEAGTTSPPQTVMLHNVGPLDATALTFQILGDGFLADTSDCGTTLPANGGQCEVSITFTPPGPGPAEATLEVNADYGAFSAVGLGGTGATETEAFIPMGLDVDPEPIISDANGVFEPGELVMVAPVWQNGGVFAQVLEGTASSLTGPEGPIYSLLAPNADYGEVEPGQVSSCQATELCYEMDIGPVGVPRPAPHWDATFDEALSDETTHTWSLHLGDSFLDVPRASPFYAAVETLLHSGVTGGCTDFGYCPTGPNTRAQMPVFVLKALEGTDYVPPACEADTQVFADVPHTSLFCPWIEELANRNLIAGCGGDNYCPNVPVTRAQMAIFLLKTLEGDGYEPPECSGEFTDVTCPSLFAAWIEELADRNVTAGCSVDPPAYCPAAPVTRQQMAVFITKTFGLDLYGP